MASLFKQASVEALEQRRDAVDREIAGLLKFRERIERRIAYLHERASLRAGVWAAQREAERRGYEVDPRIKAAHDQSTGGGDKQA